ncbi:ABC transporter permease [Gloeobacter violaceus]|uniref:Na+ ABC transporter permease protein n=1 Tax=Gloeobacter violaceus (strain ATCC 29082 / PCC 7421) TaxID=251221 RepID=Q7NPK4_GLOVI|nr:ABC transporter permease [Gloeobacter violaceus]BAC87992.1 Na+ ABC transporter permease protein [Gloeobacter violaceus PCC 7421]
MKPSARRQDALDRIGVVFCKEVIDNLRDRRTLLTALLTPLTGPLILAATVILAGQVISQEAEKPVTLPVAGTQNAPQLVAFLESQPGVEVRPLVAVDEAQVRSGQYDFALVIPPEFGREWRAGRPAAVRLIVDTGRRQTSGALARVRALLAAYSRQIASLRLLARGINPAIQQAVAVESVDVASSEGRAAFILGLMPFYLMFAAFIGGFYVAIDTTTGERERGSLEPLVINPVARWELIVGKLAATLLFALVVVAETLVGLAAVLAVVPLEQFGLRYSFNPSMFVGLFLLCLPVVLLAGAVLTILASYARSFKEAQNYLTPIILVPTFPSLLVALLPLKAEGWAAFVPIYSQLLLMSQIIKGEAVNGGFAAVSSLFTLVVGGVLVWLATRIFDRESVV